MNTDDMRRKLLTDRNFIALKRFDFSVEKVIEKYPNGVPDKLIAAALLMSEEEVEELYQKVVVKLRRRMDVEVDEE